MTPDEIRDARAHFASRVEVAERDAQELRRLLEAETWKGEAADFYTRLVASVERDGKLAAAAVEGLDALERERKMQERTTEEELVIECPCGHRQRLHTGMKDGTFFVEVHAKDGCA